MDRWSGVVKVSLNPNNAGPFFKIAASLLVSPSSKTLIAPSLNAIFFNGDRVHGTGNPVVERLSDSRYIAQLLVSKLGRSDANAWVLDAASFKGPFAVYKEFIPSVNDAGDPKSYDADGFPASSNIVKILSKSIDQISNVLSSNSPELAASTFRSSLPSSPTALPKTVILGFSKGGTVINQIMAELAHVKLESAGTLINSEETSPQFSVDTRDKICPTSKDELLSSISEIHYVDVGLNSAGAYLTERAVVGKAVKNLLVNHDRICFVLHGTPRQWCDKNRPWICKEKDLLLKLLNEESHRCEGKLQLNVNCVEATVNTVDVNKSGDNCVKLKQNKGFPPT